MHSTIASDVAFELIAAFERSVDDQSEFYVGLPDESDLLWIPGNDYFVLINEDTYDVVVPFGESTSVTLQRIADNSVTLFSDF